MPQTGARCAAGSNGAGERREAVGDDLGDACGAGGEQEPLRLPFRPPRLRPRVRRPAYRRERQANDVHRAVTDDGVELGPGDEGGQVVSLDVRRAKQHPARDPVEFGDGNRPEELVLGGNKHPAATKALRVNSETRQPIEVRESRHMAFTGENAAGQIGPLKGFPERGGPRQLH